MNKYDVIVIGGGFAGLTCALALAKEGRVVGVLEKESVAGGAFQSFKRKGQRLETGFHFVGGVRQGEVMWPIINYFGLDTLPWQPLDEAPLEVNVRGRHFELHRGYDAFVESLAAEFPSERRALQQLADLLKELNQHIYETILPGTEGKISPLMAVSAKEYLEEHFADPLLRDVLCGQSITTELGDKLPLYSFLQSLNTFVQGSYRLAGGGEALIQRLVDNLTAEGGELLTRCAVEQFCVGEDGRVRAVRCADGVEYEADMFISTLHPALTVAAIPECTQVRKIYRKRLSNLVNTTGMFTVQLVLKPGTVPYKKRNISIFNADDLWHTPCGKEDKVQNMLISYNVPTGDPRWADNIDLLTPMTWDAVSEWADSRVGRRPEEYRQLKQHKAEECIALACKYLPELQNNIVEYWTSTPLTYRDYTGTQNGSAYGVRKMCDNLLGSVLSPATPFPNLLMAGQNMMLHGMMGTAMTSLRVCNAICGKNLVGKCD